MFYYKMDFKLFLIFMLILGAILIYFTLYSQQSLADSCVNDYLTIPLNIILVLGILLFMLPITSFICNIKCDSCDFDMPYESILGVIFLLLTVCGIFVLNSLKDTNCYNKYLLYYSSSLTICSSVIFMYLVGKYYKNYFEKSKITDESSNEQSNISN